MRRAANASLEGGLQGRAGSRLWALEVKRGLSPKVERGFHSACDDVKPERRVVVYAGSECVPLPHDVEAVGFTTLAQELAKMA